MTDTNAAETGSAEDVELLARRLMGWVPSDEVPPEEFAWKGHWWRYRDESKDHVPTCAVEDDHDEWGWNPFVHAEHDVQVLERVRHREWNEGQSAEAFRWRLFDLWRNRVRTIRGHAADHLAEYVVGDYARAALAVLKEMEATR